MNVFERSAALAEYDFIQTAKYNEADAIACFKSETTIIISEESEEADTAEISD